MKQKRQSMAMEVLNTDFLLNLQGKPSIDGETRKFYDGSAIKWDLQEQKWVQGKKWE